MQGLLIENVMIVPDHIVDLNTAAITGDYVSLEGYERAVYVHICGDGTAGSDVDYTLNQAQDIAGTGVKNLSAMITGKVYSKVHATALGSLGAWVADTIATATYTRTSTINGETVYAIVFEVLATDLDIANAFMAVQMDISDPGAAKLGCGFWLLYKANGPTDPILMENPLV